MNTQRTAVKYWGFALAINIFVSLIGYFIHYKWDEGKTKNEIKLRALKEEWPQLKVKFHSVIEDFDQKAKEGVLSSNDLDALFTLQKEWVLFSSNHRGVYFPDSFEIMEDVDSRLTSHHGAMLWEESVALERAAKNIYPTNPEQASAIAESIDLMKQALEKQRFINDNYPDHEYSNYARFANLEAWIFSKEAYPIEQKLHSAIEDAQIHLQNENWKNAIEASQKVIDLQIELNDEFPNAPQANINTIIAYEDLIQESKAQLLYQESLAHEAKGKTYWVAEKNSLAQDHFHEALALQNQINVMHSQSPRASSNRSTRLSSSLQTIRSRELLDKIRKMDQELDLFLSVNMLDKAEYKIEDLVTALQSLRNDFPLAEDTPENIIQKVEFMRQNLPNLPGIWEDFSNLLRDAQLHGNLRITNFVTQSLYEKIMPINPSRIQNPARPVDSVSFDDVTIFLQRLNWATDSHPRLPKSNETGTIAPDGSGILQEWIEPDLNRNHALVFKHGQNENSVEERDEFSRNRSLSFRLVIPSDSHNFPIQN
ncbi:MAG: hypothetical protein MI748_06165 [Opitutales bacterium]|nr:hypothetical protein [Opitutales bacterium]